MKNAIVTINGLRADALPASDRAIHFGDGLFETMRVSRNRAEHLGRHLRRLREGCARLKITRVDWQGLREEIEALAATRARAVLKVVLTRGCGAPGYRFDPQQPATRMLMLGPLPRWPRQNRAAGVRTRVCQTRLAAQPLLAGIKHLNRLEQVLASAECDDPEIAEGLMLDRHGRLIEGIRSNVFLVCDETLVTPALTDCGVAGIMRSVVLDLAGELGLASEVRVVTLDDARRAGELFVCNSLIGIWPVRGIDRLARYSVGRVGRSLIEALDDHRDTGKEHWYSS